MDSTETREVNIPLLRKAVEWAEAEAAKPPELCEWNQGWWQIPAEPDSGFLRKVRGVKSAECGTTYCIAGYVCAVTEDRDRDHGWARAALNALGLTLPENVRYPEQHPLFDASNTIADVRRIAEDLAGERL